MFTPIKIPKVAPSYEAVQTLSRILSALPRLSLNVSREKLAKVKKATSMGKTRIVTDSFMAHHV